MKLKTNKPLLASIGLLLVCVVTLFKRYLLAVGQTNFRLPGDFEVYLLAWQRAQTGGIPYVISDGSPYKYSPAILSLIALLPTNPRTAWLVFGALSLAFWVAAILIGIRIRTWGDFFKLGLGLVLSWKGVLECLDYGQLEFLLFFFAVLGARLFFVSPLASGFILGLLPAFKLPWLALFVPFFVKATELPSEKGSARSFTMKLAAGYLGAALCWLLVLPSVLFGLERTGLMMKAWGALLRAQPLALYVSDINQSFFGGALRLLTRRGSGLFLISSLEDARRLSLGIAFILGGIFLGFLLQRFIRSRLVSRENILAWATPWILFCQLVNPLAWRWGSVFVVGAFCGPVLRSSSSKWVKFLLPCIALIWALQQNSVVRLLGFSHWTDLHSFPLVTLYWLALLLL